MSVTAFPAHLARPSAAIRRPIEANRVRPVIVAHHADDRAELISAVLLAIEAAPMTTVLCYPSRDIGGSGQVQVMVGEIAFALRPDDCRFAAHALLHERGGEPGVLQTVATLREAAGVAEVRTARGGPLNGRPYGVTGRATVVILAALFVGTTLGAAIADWVRSL